MLTMLSMASRLGSGFGRRSPIVSDAETGAFRMPKQVWAPSRFRNGNRRIVIAVSKTETLVRSRYLEEFHPIEENHLEPCSVGRWCSFIFKTGSQGKGKHGDGIDEGRFMETFNALETAKRRWQSCTISGSGNIAVVLKCRYHVVLCGFLLEAQALAGSKCCANCSHGIIEGKWHEIVELQPPARPATRMRGNFAAYMAAD
jgi:hypothetical protein